MKWLRNFMYGRYGNDQFNNFLFGCYLVCILLSLFFREFVFLSYIFVAIMFYRMFSKQYQKRRNENYHYLRLSDPFRKIINRQKNKWKYRKTHKYYRCPSCHQYLRVPKNKGNITITCPTCKHQFDKRT